MLSFLSNDMSHILKFILNLLKNFKLWIGKAVEKIWEEKDYAHKGKYSAPLFWGFLKFFQKKTIISFCWALKTFLSISSRVPKIYYVARQCVQWLFSNWISSRGQGSDLTHSCVRLVNHGAEHTAGTCWLLQNMSPYLKEKNAFLWDFN